MGQDVQSKSGLDALEVRFLLLTFVAAEMIAIMADKYASDNAATGVALAMFGPPLVLGGAYAWLKYFTEAARRRQLRRAASRLIGPITGVLAVLLLARIGMPPWRVWSELMRPYYLIQVWLTPPDAGGHKLLIFPQLHRDYYYGWETRDIIYADAEKLESFDSRAGGEQPCMRQDSTDLGFGFHARHIIASFVGPCPAE